MMNHADGWMGGGMWIWAGVLMIGGCAATPGSPPLSPDHPASVDAPEAPYAPFASVLVEDRAEPLPGAATQPLSPGTGIEHHDMADTPSATAATTGNQPTEQPQPQAAIYTCPMHPEVVRNAPGRCPKCGMTLVETQEHHSGVQHD